MSSRLRETCTWCRGTIQAITSDTIQASIIDVLSLVDTVVF